MHFDPAADHPAAFDESVIGGPELFPREEEPAPRSREGLPPAFRMRHGRHYVEQLMGDAPIRTVRDIAINEIEIPPDAGGDTHALEESIRKVGILQPLLVAKQDGQYRVIAGVNRLRAALAVGLRVVPCLVHEVAGEALERLRSAASESAAPDGFTAPVDPAAPAPPSALTEVTSGLAFVNALMPILEAASENSLRWQVLTDLMAAELQRGKAIASAAELVAHEGGVVRESVEIGQLLEAVLTGIRAEARLRGVTFDLSLSDPAYRLSVDPRILETGVGGMLHALLGCTGNGGKVRIRIEGTVVRPALIVEATSDSPAATAFADSRCFDADWTRHPAGPGGSVMLAAAARAARLHGGRVSVRATGIDGCLLTLIVPRPLSDL